MPQPIVPKPASPKPPTVSQANTTVLRIKPKNEVPIQLVQALDALNKPNPTYPDGQPIVIKPLRGGLKVELSEPAVGVSPVQVQSLTVPRAEGGLPPVIARAIGPVSPVTTAIKPLTPVFTPTAPAVTLIKPLAPVVTPISPVVTPAPAPAPAIRLALPVKAVQPVGPTPLAAQPVRVAQPIGVAPQAKATALPSLASFQLQPAPIGLGEQQVQPIDVAAFLQALGRG